MKKALFLLIFGFYLNPVAGQLKDLNLYFETDVVIDSIFISNISQDKEFQFVKYTNPLHITFQNKIDDLYNIDFYTQKGFKRTLFWLRGKQIVIKGKVSDKIKIDTVIGSDQYYQAAAFKKQYLELMNQGKDSTAINNFLLEQLRQNLTQPFSVDIAQTFFYPNISKKHQLRKIYTLLSSQEEAIKNHSLNPYKKIDKILNETRIDFSGFQFYTTENTLTSLALDPKKKYLVDFWFIGCAPCIADHKLIIQKLDILKSQNIEVVGISIDQKQKSWEDFLKSHSYNWLNVREVDVWEKKLRNKMMIEVYPTYLLLDGKGTILFRSNSFTEVSNHLKL